MASNSARSAAAVGAFAVLAAAITTVILVAGGGTPAGAAELERFASCAEMQAWTEDVAVGAPGWSAAPDVGVAEGGGAATAGGTGGDAATGPGAPMPATRDEADTASTAAGGELSETGGTNTVVEGVDEIDIVDRLDGDRALVARNGMLSLVDLSGPTLLASVEVPGDARISVGGEVVWVAGTAWDEATGTSRTTVARYRLAGDALEGSGQWQSPGWLLDARRTGDRLHVVAVDQPQVGILPFEDGPVPCDQVWYPQAGADTPAATMLVTLPAEGDLAPTAAAEVVGSGAGFHVTSDAAYVTTQSWPGDGSQPTTGVHRFDLASLSPTGSGAVPGIVPGPFGLSEYEGYLRVATSAQPDLVVMPVEPAGDAATEPAPAAGGALAEVFVLDLDGDLDIVGRTGRFGRDGETIQGIRFVGATAYVVTFLQTDPFWVLDLADPAAPVVVGELQIPGFSAYLHPVTEGHVVGFGPDGEGRMAARLFDVRDPQGPALVDELVLGDDSPVAWDYHAFVALDDGRFAVPVNDWPTYDERCTTVEPAPEPIPLPEPAPDTTVPPETTVPPDTPVTIEPVPVDPGIGDGSGASPGGGAAGQVCEVTASGGRTGVSVLAVDGDSLRLDEEAFVDSDGAFTSERALPHSGGWVLVGWDRLVDPAGGELILPAGSGTGGPVIID